MNFDNILDGLTEAEIREIQVAEEQTFLEQKAEREVARAKWALLNPSPPPTVELSPPPLEDEAVATPPSTNSTHQINNSSSSSEASPKASPPPTPIPTSAPVIHGPTPPPAPIISPRWATLSGSDLIIKKEQLSQGDDPSQPAPGDLVTVSVIGRTLQYCAEATKQNKVSLF